MFGELCRTGKAPQDTGRRKKSKRTACNLDFLATDRSNPACRSLWGALILPYSIAVTDKDAKEIERFMTRGGVVYGDEQTGPHRRTVSLAKQPLWDEPRQRLHSNRAEKCRSAARLWRPALVTVRNFGDWDLIVRCRAGQRFVSPKPPVFRYDLLREDAAAAVKARPDKPVYRYDFANRHI